MCLLGCVKSGSMVIKLFQCSTQLSMKFCLLINSKLLKSIAVFFLSLVECKIFCAYEMKMPTLIGIFIFISRENFMFSWVEHVNKFLISGSDIFSFLFLTARSSPEIGQDLLLLRPRILTFLACSRNVSLALSIYVTIEMYGYTLDFPKGNNFCVTVYFPRWPSFSKWLLLCCCFTSTVNI